jgi:hypothetical protein
MSDADGASLGAANVEVGGAAPVPEPSGTVSLGVSGLLLPSSPGFPPPLIDWRRVEDNAVFARSQVAAAERLLH